MARKVIYSREEIILNAVELVSKEGIEALSARRLASKLGTSSKPIFVTFTNMDELKAEVTKASHTKYESYILREFEENKYPFHMACGMGYIRFAKEEPNLFKMLFMEKPSDTFLTAANNEVDGIVDKIVEVSHLPREKARLFHAEMWLVMHGIATTIVTKHHDWSDDEIVKLLDIQFKGLKYALEEKSDDLD